MAKSVGIHCFGGFEHIFRCYGDTKTLKNLLGHMDKHISVTSGLSSGALVQTGDSQATTTIKPVANKVQ